jgi:uncharacterized protein (DUF1697 family)
MGLGDVATYIQSGNVAFTAADSGADKLARRIEAALAATFGGAVKVFLRSRKQLRDIVARAPAGFGTQPARYRYLVIFLKAPLTAAAVIKSVVPKPGVDRVHGGAGVVYFTRLTSKATQSRFSKIVSLPIYQDMTIRNWNTTTALLRLTDLRLQGDAVRA